MVFHFFQVNFYVMQFEWTVLFVEEWGNAMSGE